MSVDETKSVNWWATLSPRRVIRTLLVSLAVLVGLALLGLVIRYLLAAPLGLTLGERSDPASLHSLLYYFNPADSFNLGEWAVAVLHLLAAALLGGVALHPGMPYRAHWAGLAGLLAFLSINEVTFLTNRALPQILPLLDPVKGYPAYGPVLVWVTLGGLALVGYAPFVRDLPPAARRSGLLALLVYGGAALIENAARAGGSHTFGADVLALALKTLQMLAIIGLMDGLLRGLANPDRLIAAQVRPGLSHLGWTVLALLLVFAVLLGGAVTRNMRPDEAIALEGTRGTLLTTIEYQAADVHAPLYFVGFHLWQQVVGDGELTGRYFSLLQSMLTAALIFHLGRRWFGKWGYGLGGLLALGLSSYFFKYGIEIRPYATVMLVSAVSMLAFSRWLARRTWQRAAGYGLSVMLMLYLHYFGLFLMLAQGLYLLGWLVARRSQPVRANLTLIGQAAGAYAGAFVLWLPWFPIFMRQVRHVGQLVPEDQTQIAGLGMAGTTFATNWPTLSRFLAIAFNALPWLALPLLVLGGLRLWKRQAYWQALGWGVGVPVLMFIVNLIVPVYEPRYATPLVPGLALLFGVSMVALFPRRPLLPLVGVLGVGLVTVSTGVGTMPPIRDHLQALETAFQPGDIVYTLGMPATGIATYHITHYAPGTIDSFYTADDSVIKPPFQPWEGTDADLPRCFWYGTSHWGEQEVITRFEALEANRPVMATAGAPAGYLFQRLCLPPEVPPQVFSGDATDALNFLGADIVNQSADALELALWWTVEAQPTRDYTIGVYVLDAGGALVAQQDGPLTDYWSGVAVPVAALEPGRYHIDRRFIPLPQGLPPGEYTLSVAVYRPEDGTRLPVADAPDDLLRVMPLRLP